MLSRPEVYELMLPFAPSEHGFTPVGGGQVPYIKKSAIERRFHRVVPGWELRNIYHITTQNDVVVMGGAILLSGQEFAGVGTAVVQRYTKVNGQQVEVGPYELARNTAKAFKQAASDLLPRCASVAGVGWYLREAPPQWKSKIGSEQGLREYIEFVREQMKGWNPDIGTPNLGSGAAAGADRRIGSDKPAVEPPPPPRNITPISAAKPPAAKTSEATLPLVEVSHVRVEKRSKGSHEIWLYVFSDPTGVNAAEYPVIEVKAFDAIGIDHRQWRAGYTDKPLEIELPGVYQMALEQKTSAIGNTYYVIVGEVVEGLPLR